MRRVLSSFMTHRHVCNYSNMMGAISGIGKEEFEVTKGVIRIRKSTDRQHNGLNKKDKRDKQRSTKHYT